MKFLKKFVPLILIFCVLLTVFVLPSFAEESDLQFYEYPYIESYYFNPRSLFTEDKHIQLRFRAGGLTLDEEFDEVWIQYTTMNDRPVNNYYIKRYGSNSYISLGHYDGTTLYLGTVGLNYRHWLCAFTEHGYVRGHNLMWELGIQGVVATDYVFSSSSTMSFFTNGSVFLVGFIRLDDIESEFVSSMEWVDEVYNGEPGISLYFDEHHVYHTSRGYLNGWNGVFSPGGDWQFLYDYGEAFTFFSLFGLNAESQIPSDGASYSDGWDKGYEKGKQDGLKEGYDKGKEDGEDLGYKDGVRDGMNMTQSDAFGENVLSSTLSVPFEALNDFTLFEAPNGSKVTLMGVLSALIAIPILLAILKLFAGG